MVSQSLSADSVFTSLEDSVIIHTFIHCTFAGVFAESSVQKPDICIVRTLNKYLSNIFCIFHSASHDIVCYQS